MLPSGVAELVTNYQAAHRRYQLTGDRAALNVAIAVLETLREHELFPLCTFEFQLRVLNNLGARLQDRYGHTSSLADLDAAIACYRAAAEDTPMPTVEGSERLDNLAGALRLRWSHSRTPDDLAASIAAGEQAIRHMPTAAPGFPIAATNHAGSLSTAFEETHDRRHVDLAIDYARRAVAATLPDSEWLGSRLVVLASTLSTRYHAFHDADDLQECRTLLERAVTAARGQFSVEYGAWFAYANALRDSVELTGSADDLAACHAAYRRAGGLAVDFQPGSAMDGAIVWGNWARDRGDWTRAAEAYRLALDALHKVHERQLLREHKETWLSHAVSLTADAGYAIAHVDVGAAAVAMENGRALYLSESLGRDAIDLRRLHTGNHADLACQFTDLASTLKTGDLGARRSALEAFEQVVAQIRRVPGYADFLAAVDYPQLASLAGESVLIYLCAAEPGAAAVLVDGGDPGQPTVCWPPNLSRPVLRGVIERYVGAYRQRREAPGRWLRVLDQTARWAWDWVLTHLATERLTGRRVVLIPLGSLALIPWHAAWRAEPGSTAGRAYPLDRLQLSYAPNARTLAPQSTPQHPASVVAIEDPRPVSAGPLPSARREVEATLACFAGTRRRLRGVECTRDEVMRAIADCQVVHFACHARADTQDPWASHLLMSHDEPLTVEDLGGLSLAQARLAVLSACETAVPGEVLPDEMVALPTALMGAGVRGVIASLWAVPDQSTALLVGRFHQLWREREGRPAEALRAAQFWLRDSTDAEITAVFPWFEPGTPAPDGTGRFAHPYFWAPFAYYGV